MIFKNIAEEYAFSIWDKKDLSAIKKFLHPEIIIHSLLGDYHCQEVTRSIVAALLIGFPDLVVQNKAIISEQD